MLKRIVGSILLVGLMPLPAAQAAGADCDGDWCTIGVTNPGSGENPGDNEGVNPGKDSGGGEVQDCGYKRLSPQPPKGASSWGGKAADDGAIYQKVCPGRLGSTPLVFIPTGETPAPPPPDPQKLAESAIASMQLKPVSIATVPKSGANKVGLVGMPAWMWSASKASNVTGPVTKTATAGPWSVSLTAHLQRTSWQMGKGEDTVICNGSNATGTPYKASYGKKDSPTCGYRYSDTGDFAITATSHWLVTWQGIGQTGQIPVKLSDTTTITIGEVQVLTQR